MVKLICIVFLILFINSCDMKESFQKHNEAQKQADYIVNNLGREEILEKFPENFFDRNETKKIIDYLVQKCDWENRDGKFVDFFTIGKIGKVEQTGFIYEYYLKCDSIRAILIFDMNKKIPELFAFKLEGIELENKFIVHPENQLINRNK